MFASVCSVVVSLFLTLFLAQCLHQEREAPYPHRNEDCEEDDGEYQSSDGEPQGYLGDETVKFVHERLVYIYGRKGTSFTSLKV